MQGLDTQIQQLHLEKGLTVDQISEGLGVDIGHVTLALNKIPPRKKSNSVKDDISKHARDAIDVISGIMMDEDNNSGRTRLDAAKFVTEVALGKHDAVKDISQMNIQNLNVILNQGREKYREINQQVEEVEIEEISTTEREYK